MISVVWLVTVSPFGIVFDLASFHFFQQIIDIFVISQRHLDAHALQTLHRGLPHTAADEILAIGNIFEFGSMGGIAPHALPMSMPVFMVVVMMMMVMIVIIGIGQLAQLLFGDLTVVEGDDEKGPGLSEVTGYGLAIIGGDSDFDCHNDFGCSEWMG